MRKSFIQTVFIFLLAGFAVPFFAFSQNPFSAHGYWTETTKEPYYTIWKKQEKGDSLSVQEKDYLKDYGDYLAGYFGRLSDEEKALYQQMKDSWDKALEKPVDVDAYKPETFEWRGRDRLLNVLYGAWYGGTIVLLGNIQDAGAVGIPLITGGSWLLGPVIMPKKYEGITETTMRACNTGKFLGLGYGAALGLAMVGTEENGGDLTKVIAALSTVGSIALGEVGFHWQKERGISDGHVELMRHYGIIGPLTGIAGIVATGADDGRLAGVSMLAGGVVGLVIGNHAAKKYDYTRGDVDAISTRSWIYTGLALTTVINAIDDNDDVNALILVPAAGMILGTVLGQKSVKGVRLTKKQGSTINLATAGAALIGLGAMAAAGLDSPAAAIGVPSVAALLTHHIVFHEFKMKNLELKLRGDRKHGSKMNVAMNFNPENYFVNKQIPAENYSPQVYTRLMNPVLKLRFIFN